MSVTPLPTLDQLVAEPARARELPPEVAERLLAHVHVLEGTLFSRLLAARGTQNGPPEAPAEADRLLTPEEAAHVLGVEVAWLYRHRRRLPFARKLSHKTVRYSEAGLRKWQAAKRA